MRSEYLFGENASWLFLSDILSWCEVAALLKTQQMNHWSFQLCRLQTFCSLCMSEIKPTLIFNHCRKGFWNKTKKLFQHWLREDFKNLSENCPSVYIKHINFYFFVLLNFSILLLCFALLTSAPHPIFESYSLKLFLKFHDFSLFLLHVSPAVSYLSVFSPLRLPLLSLFWPSAAVAAFKWVLKS